MEERLQPHKVQEAALPEDVVEEKHLQEQDKRIIEYFRQRVTHLDNTESA